MRYVCTRARVQSLTESVRARTRTQGRSGLHARTACEVRSLECVSFTVGSLFQGRVHILARHAGVEAGKVCSVRVHGGGARASALGASLRRSHTWVSGGRPAQGCRSAHMGWTMHSVLGHAASVLSAHLAGLQL